MTSAMQASRIRLKPASQRWVITLAVIIVLAVVPGVLPAQTTRPAGKRPQYLDAHRVPDQLLNQRPRQVLVLPSEPGEFGEAPTQLSGGAVAKLAPDIHRLPDGYVVASREARIDPQGRWYVAHLASGSGIPEAPPMRILPNKRLMMIEAIYHATQKPPTLIITGRVTEFQGVNYLLIETLAEPVSIPAAKPEKRMVSSQKPGSPALTSRPQGSTSHPAAADKDDAIATPPVVGEPKVEDIVAKLMESKPLRAVALPDHLPKVATDPASPAEEKTQADKPGQEGPRWTEETMLIDQVGRIVPGERWWSLAFEDSGKTPVNPPVRLLPNRLLEDALAISGGGTRSIVFIVSGEVTEYRKTNYVLLRKVLVRHDLGNFR